MIQDPESISDSFLSQEAADISSQPSSSSEQEVGVVTTKNPTSLASSSASSLKALNGFAVFNLGQ